MNRWNLSRRQMLRGLLGGGAAVVVGLPPLEAMLDSHGEAYANGEPIPKRFGMWAWGNGVKPAYFIPSTTGTSWQGLPPESLKPFAEASAGDVVGALEYVSLVTRTWVPFAFSWAHATSWVGLMTGSQPLDKNGTPDFQTGLFPEKAEGPFVLDLITDAIGGATKFARIDARISRAVSGADYLTGEAESSQHNPQALFNKLFLRFQPDATPPSQGLINARKSVLDAVAADALDLKKRLGAADTHRLDQHLSNIAAIEKGLENVNLESCVVPTDPGPRPPDPGGGAEPLQEVNTAMSDLIAYALACDLTRVFNVSFSDIQSSPHFAQVGVPEGHHGLGHDEPDPQPKCQKTTVFIMQQLAYLAAKLKSIPVGASDNLLDHCCIWGTSEIEGHNSHSFYNIPHLVIGRAGGALKGGVHVDAAGNPDWYHRFDKPSALSSCVVLTMMRAIGMNVPSFGVGQAASSATMPELES